MGTTVTTNLGLIKPDTSESIEENLPTFDGWATQNAANCNKIDTLFRHSLDTYSPSWTADSVNPTLGSGGFTEGKFIRLYPRLVIGYFRLFTGGAGFATGTGLYRWSLPVAVSSELLSFNDSIPVGKAYLQDNNVVANCTVLVVMYDVTNNVFFFRKHDGDFWRQNTPFTMEQNDRLNGYFMYPTAAA